MCRISFPHPVPGEKVPELMGALAFGRSVVVGQVTFSKDEHGVWGTDPYGRDFLLGGELDEGKILACVDRHHDSSTVHPAEYCH